MHKLSAVRPGDRVAVIAPASPFDRESFEVGLSAIATRYEVSYDPTLFDRHRYLAGSDERRLAELNSALADPAIKAVFCARGGYGAMRLLPRLASPPAPLKPLIGFSDITAIHLWLQQQGYMSVHAPVITQFGKQSAEVQQRLFTTLESSDPPPPLQGDATFVPGIAVGPLLGGNLSVLTRLLGTPYLPSFEGAVLLLEDVAERPYRVDRMWTHLELAGVLRQIRGIVLGEFASCEERNASFTSADILRELAAAAGIPCAAGFQIGHGEINQAVPLGVRVELNADTQTLTFLQSAVTAC